MHFISNMHWIFVVLHFSTLQMPQIPLRHSYLHIQIIPATYWQHYFATNLQPRFPKAQYFRAFPAFFSYSNSFRGFYRQLSNADISYIFGTSISPNIALFASFSKFSVAN